MLIIDPENFENKPEPLDKEIIVDSSCGTAVLRGADIFVPGVLAANSSKSFTLFTKRFVARFSLNLM